MHRKLLLLAAALLDFLGRMHTEQKNTFRPLTLLLLLHSFFLALLSLPHFRSLCARPTRASKKSEELFDAAAAAAETD